MRFTSYFPALDTLTIPLISLSKPVDPFVLFGDAFSVQFILRTVSKTDKTEAPNISLNSIFVSQQIAKAIP